jgi:lipoprotein-anchoring transpeptidase ErfK/SrfK
MRLPGDGFCATRVLNMRLSMSSPTFRSLLAVPFLAAMLAFPASAETNPNAATPQAEAEATPSTGESNGATTGDQNGSTETPADQSAAPANETPKSSIVVNVDKSSQEMTVFVDGVEKYSWPVSTGQSGYSTPSGTFTASSMNKIWYSKQWDNAPMPHAVFFTKEGHAIHATKEVKNLGKPASHGCVRLSPENAATLYALVEENGLENTQVVLSGTTPGGEGPKVASPGKQPRGYAYGVPPWFDGQYQYYQQPQPQRRRGLFGRRWYQQQQGGNYYYPPRRGY